MFFRERLTQAEYFDLPGRTPEEVAGSYEELRRVNRFFHSLDPYQRLLPHWLGPDRCRSLSILDLGAGDGSLGRQLTAWAAKRNWDWKFTCLDQNPHALALNPGGRNVLGSVLDLPFPDNSFDVVTASQMTHHLESDEEIVVHFREARRVARHLTFINDLHRNGALYAVIWMMLHFGRYTKPFREDGLLSLKRGFRVPEWRRFAREAGMPSSEVWVYFGSRIMLLDRKEEARAAITA